MEDSKIVFVEDSSEKEGSESAFFVDTPNKKGSKAIEESDKMKQDDDDDLNLTRKVTLVKLESVVCENENESSDEDQVIFFFFIEEYERVKCNFD